jgi:site-specific recombinase XerD
MSVLRSQFIDQLHLKGLSDSTVENYVSNISSLSRHYKVSPLDLSAQQISDYLLHLLRDRKLFPSTVNLHIDSMKSFYALMAPGSTIMDNIPHVKNVHRLPLVLSRQEVDRMIAATENLKHRAALMLLYSAGLRLMECVNLKPCHIESQRMKIRIEQGKGKVDRYTTLSEKTLKTLKEYYRKYRPKVWLFEGQKGGEQYSARSIEVIVKNAARHAKIGKNVHPHTLRHSFATHLMESGIALPLIQRLLGHRSIRTTMLYLHLGDPLRDKTISPLDLDNDNDTDTDPEVANV